MCLIPVPRQGFRSWIVGARDAFARVDFALGVAFPPTHALQVLGHTSGRHDGVDVSPLPLLALGTDVETIFAFVGRSPSQVLSIVLLTLQPLQELGVVNPDLPPVRQDTMDLGILVKLSIPGHAVCPPRPETPVRRGRVFRFEFDMLEAVHDDDKEENRGPQIAVEANLTPEVLLPPLLALGGDESTDLGLDHIDSRNGIEEGELWAWNRTGYQ